MKIHLVIQNLLRGKTQRISIELSFHMEQPKDISCCYLCYSSVTVIPTWGCFILKIKLEQFNFSDSAFWDLDEILHKFLVFLFHIRNYEHESSSQVLKFCLASSEFYISLNSRHYPRSCPYLKHDVRRLDFVCRWNLLSWAQQIKVLYLALSVGPNWVGDTWRQTKSSLHNIFRVH
jgi:hypothetical protein